MAENLDEKIIYRGLEIENVDPGQTTADRSAVVCRIKGKIGGHPFDVNVTLGLTTDTAEFESDDDRTCEDAYVDLLHQHQADLIEAAEGCQTFRQVAIH